MFTMWEEEYIQIRSLCKTSPSFYQNGSQEKKLDCLKSDCEVMVIGNAIIKQVIMDYHMPGYELKCVKIFKLADQLKNHVDNQLFV